MSIVGKISTAVPARIRYPTLLAARDLGRPAPPTPLLYISFPFLPPLSPLEDGGLSEVPHHPPAFNLPRPHLTHLTNPCAAGTYCRNRNKTGILSSLILIWSMGKTINKPFRQFYEEAHPFTYLPLFSFVLLNPRTRSVSRAREPASKIDECPPMRSNPSLMTSQ